MHILFLSDNFPPEVNAPASRTIDHCREWVRQGHRVTVITCAPNFPRGRVFAGYRNKLWQTERVDGIRVIRVWSYITANQGFAKRVFDYLSFMVTGFLASLFVRRIDVIIGTSPQFFVACAAFATSVVRRRPWLFELRDIWPESIRAVGVMKQNLAFDLLEKIELFLYRRADAIVSVTHAFKRSLVARGIAPDKIAVVTNGVDCARFRPLQKDEELLESLGLTGMFVAGYVGTHGLAHGLDTLLDAAAFLRDRPEGAHIRILMLGDGAEREQLLERAGRERIDNVLFIESVPKEDVARYWSILDVSIVHLKRAALFETVIPSKIFECMGMGIPIVHGIPGESAEIIKSRQVGVLFEPENAHQLAEKLLALERDYSARTNFSANGPVAAREYDRTGLAKQMLKVIERCGKAGS